jgi:hypothetical protein
LRRLHLAAQFFLRHGGHAEALRSKVELKILVASRQI